jgi:hypothetical protein
MCPLSQRFVTLRRPDSATQLHRGDCITLIDDCIGTIAL